MNEVKCINKQPRDNIWERITHLGGITTSGRNWKKTQKEVIDYIEAGTASFYVKKDNNKVYLIVAESQFGNKYVKTESDERETNNLLSLPECKA